MKTKSMQSIHRCQSLIHTSYDIVKAHGGELKVERKEAHPYCPVGRGVVSEFIIQLPIK